MMPASKGDYVKCAWMCRYCSHMCPHCKEGRDPDDNKLYFYCWLPFALYERPAIQIIKKEIAHFDNFGNVYIGEVW